MLAQVQRESSSGYKRYFRQNLAIARGFQPMEASQMQALRDRCAVYTADGRLYKNLLLSRGIELHIGAQRGVKGG